jgi:4-hydroxybenzoyl-CoA thioesterase
MTYLVSQRQVTIEWGHCDPAGIVFNSRFFEFFDASTGLLFQRALGMKKVEMMAAFQCDIPLVDARARYMVPARFGDEVEISSTIGEFRRSSFDVQHRLFKDGKLAVEGQETRVWIGRHAEDPSRLRSKPIPPEVIARFKTA